MTPRKRDDRRSNRYRCTNRCNCTWCKSTRRSNAFSNSTSWRCNISCNSARFRSQYCQQACQLRPFRNFFTEKSKSNNGRCYCRLSMLGDYIIKPIFFWFRIHLQVKVTHRNDSLMKLEYRHKLYKLINISIFITFSY